jgi:uncharacterized membrane protein YkoI
MFRSRRTALIAASAAVVLLIGGGGVAGIAATRATDDEDDAPITGQALERASAAALAHTGGGRVTETEVGDEESMYEVEVTLDDGTQVDVQLDANFNVVSDEVDHEDDGGDAADDD